MGLLCFQKRHQALSALGIGVTCTIYNDWAKEQKIEQGNYAPSPEKTSAAAGYRGPVKTEFLKGAGLQWALSSNIPAA